MASEPHGAGPGRDLLARLGAPLPPAGMPAGQAAALSVRWTSVAVRLGLTPVLVGFALTAPTIHPVFWLVAAARLVWLVRALRRPLRLAPSPARLTRWSGPIIELSLIAGLVATSGAAGSPLAIPLVAFPVIAGVQFARGATAIVGAFAFLAFLIPAGPALLDGDADALGAVTRTATDIGFATLAGIGLAHLRYALTLRALAVDAARRQLLSASLSAEDGERRRVSREIHAGALQELLATVQDIAEAEAGDRGALVRARAGLRSGVAMLRATVRELHPAAARHIGLPTALRIAMERRVVGAVQADVEEPVRGCPEALLLALVREIGDALAAADVRSDVALRLRGDGHTVLLGVEVGAAPGARGALEACRERVEADGGTLELGDSAGTASASVRLLATEAPALAAHPDGSADDRLDRVVRAALHVAVTPVVLLYGVQSDRTGPLFVPVVLGGLVVFLAGLALTLSPAWRRYPRDGGVPAETLLVGVLFAVTGGVDSDLRAIVMTFALLLPFQFAARRAAALTGIIALGFVAASAGQVLRGDPGAAGQALAWLLGLAWATCAGHLLHLSIERVRLRGLELEAARRAVLHNGLAAADAERQRLSERLHDEALQTLMVCGQELDEALDGEESALLRARTELLSGVALLREAVAELHPPALEHGGLRSAIAAIAATGRDRSGFATRVSVDPEADGIRDELVVALVRELVTNAVKHAGAAVLDVRITVDPERGLAITIDDDGVGMAPGRAWAAIAEGHIGLAAARERVEAEGGRFTIATAPGSGVRIAIRLPAAVATA